MSELVLNLGDQPFPGNALVEKASDPVISPTASTPGDFAAQFPQPLNTNEIIAMCEEVNLWRNIPEIRTMLKAETYRELNELAFTSGSSYLSFADGECPEPYGHDGDNTTITLKNLGAYKSLTISDIMHSAAVVGMSQGRFGVGISDIIGAFPSGEGMPGGGNEGSSQATSIADLKAKEMLLASILTLNGWDRLLAIGNASDNALEFDGIEQLVTAALGSHVSASSTASGTFSATSFDRWLAESCAKPTLLAGAPQAIQEMMSSYFQLGYQGSQLVNHANGDRIVPGFNFAGEVFTGVGRLKAVADENFTRTASGAASFQSAIFALRMTHNGEPFVYKSTQIPLAFKDLVPGCTSIAFQIWAKTALIIKARCAQGRYTALFNGRVLTTCPRVGLTND